MLSGRATRFLHRCVAYPRWSGAAGDACGCAMALVLHPELFCSSLWSHRNESRERAPHVPTTKDAIGLWLTFRLFGGEGRHQTQGQQENVAKGRHLFGQMGCGDSYGVSTLRSRLGAVVLGSHQPCEGGRQPLRERKLAFGSSHLHPTCSHQPLLHVYGELLVIGCANLRSAAPRL